METNRPDNVFFGVLPVISIEKEDNVSRYLLMVRLAFMPNFIRIGIYTKFQ